MGTGGILFIALLCSVILGLLAIVIARYWRNRWLRKHGKAIIAIVDDVDIVARTWGDYITHNHRVSVRWLDPETQRAYYFQQDIHSNTRIRALDPGRSTVRVYINPQNPDDFYMIL